MPNRYMGGVVIFKAWEPIEEDTMIVTETYLEPPVLVVKFILKTRKYLVRIHCKIWLGIVVNVFGTTNILYYHQMQHLTFV